jgi:hypothetical protein
MAWICIYGLDMYLWLGYVFMSWVCVYGLGKCLWLGYVFMSWVCVYELGIKSLNSRSINCIYFFYIIIKFYP